MHDEPTADEVADALFGAIQRGDVDAVAALYADDVAVWHNYDRVAQDAATNLAVLTWLVRNVRELRYDDVARRPIDGGFVQQHVLRGTTPSGAALDVPCCMVVQVDAGRIRRIDEYLDTAHLAPLMAPGR